MDNLEKILHTKTGLSLVISASLYPLVEFIETYIFKDWQFAIFLMVIVGIDTVLGLVKHWKNHSLSSTGFAGLFTKILIYGSVLVLTHVLTRFTISGEMNGIFNWFDSVMYSAIMVRESISILENVGAISPHVLPSWLLKRLKAFDQSGNLNDLTHGNTGKEN